MTSIRIRSLQALDLQSIPLPNGTEVSSLVARTSLDGARRVPQGAVGRVASIEGDTVLVKVVGVGSVAYARDEIAPRRVGQVRFALEREAAEKALRETVLLDATVGSRAWGLANADSDTDLRGVFLLPFRWTAGLAPPPDTLLSQDGSSVHWEHRKAIDQLLRADPNTLEMLYVPEVRVRDPLGAQLVAHRDAFVSDEIYGTFGRYALSQARKLAQNARLAEHRALTTGWLRDDPALTLDATAARLAREASLALPEPEAIARCKQYLKQLCRSMHDQGLLASADFAALVSFSKTASAQFDLPRELRPKNAYNLLRLLACATQWLRTGRPLITVEGALRTRLLEIKSGQVAIAQSLAWAEAMGAELEDARARSVLPRRPDLRVAEALAREARTEAARRHFASVSGVFGPDGPPPPTPQFEQDAEPALDAALATDTP